MLTLILGWAGVALSDVQSADPVAAVRVGGYVPATCRVRSDQAAFGRRAATCNSLAVVEVVYVEGLGAADTRIARVTVRPR